jgi:hypothetical protein
MRRSTVVAITAVLVAASGVAGCGGSSSGSGSGAETLAPAPEKHSAGGVAAFGDVSGKAVAVAGPAKAQHTSLRSHDGLPHMPSTVIKTGRLSIRLGDDGLSKAIDRAQQVVDSYGGLSARATSRLASTRPPRSCCACRRHGSTRHAAAASAGAGRGALEQVSGEDVGQQLVDLSARARNLRAQSRALIRLMNQAVTVSDTIKIQNELFDIQGQIEELEGRLRYLHDQADMSTITMLLAPPAAMHHHTGQATAIGSALRRSWQRATDVVTAVIVGAGVVIPVALLALVALLVGRWLLPAVRRRTSHESRRPLPSRRR